MAIKKYVASKDTTITNAWKASLTQRGTGSNMGFSDALEVFSIIGQESSSSLEKSRILAEWTVSDISTDRTAGDIPVSGSVNFYLKMYNAKTPFTLPRDFTLVVHAVSRSWQEGTGLDMEEYTDQGYANWLMASTASTGLVEWTTEGGDFHTGTYVAGTNLPFYSQTFINGTEDLDIDITAMVEEWIAGGTGARANYGVGVYLTSSQENAEDGDSYYTKKFFARGSEFFFKRPVIEARWDSSKQDDTGNFYLSSSLASADDNLNTLYLYNYVRGQLKDIPGVATGEVFLSVYSTPGTTKITLPVGGGVVANNDFNITGGQVGETGIYSASFAFTGTATTIYPVWHVNSTEYHTGSAITVQTFDSKDYNPNPQFVTNITNLKSKYDTSEVARFRLYTRQKDWNPTIYVKATATIESEIIDAGYYRVVRVVDDLEVIAYGTGSDNYTKMSFDSSGSYFDLDMSLLQTGYAYALKFAYHINGAYHEQPEVFKFRVE